MHRVRAPPVAPAPTVGGEGESGEGGCGEGEGVIPERYSVVYVCTLCSFFVGNV